MVDINASLGLFPVACIGNTVSSYPPAMFSGKIALSTVPLLLQLLVPSNSPESLTHLRACAGSAPNRRRDEPAASRGGGRAGQSGAGRREEAGGARQPLGRAGRPPPPPRLLPGWGCCCWKWRHGGGTRWKRKRPLGRAAAGA